jgi:NAD-dependent DNA ligase
MVQILASGYKSFANLSSKLDLIPGKVVDSIFKNGNTKPQAKNPLWLAPSPAEFQTLTESLSEMGFKVHSEHMFFGKNFTISLWLESMNESDFWFCVALCGGNMKTSVSKVVDYLVEGIDPKGKYIRGNTTKSLRAKELLAKGESRIQVIDEKELLKMFGHDVLADLEKYRSNH